MVLEISPARRSGLRSRMVPSLKELPTRRPEPPAPEAAAVQWDRLDVDRYRVTVGGDAVGFIDVVGAVFVVLAGCRYDRAVEVLQTLDFAAAVRRLSPRDAERQAPTP